MDILDANYGGGSVKPEDDWLFLGDPDVEDGQVDEYDLTSTPNDFNALTIFSFIESGAVKIPGFQRHFVWDIKRASKLIESLIIGLPVPQVFLYEEARNRFLVIDGQQRLMTIYFFIKQRFPKKEARPRLRNVFMERGGIPDEVLSNDDLFEDFALKLPDLSPGRPNKFSGLTYSDLDDYKTQFDLRTIRNVVVKQVKPSGGNSSIYEMFSRLNTGGINLTPQEIRLSLYHSKFYDLLTRLNLDSRWRLLLGRPEPDLHMQDVEVLARAVAMWRDGSQYKPSMVRFLNQFSHVAQKFNEEELATIESYFNWFLDSAREVAPSAWQRQSKFSVPIFEAVFAASCSLRDKGQPVALSSALVEKIKLDPVVQDSSQEKTTDTGNVRNRLKRALELVAAANESR
ncbi:DUF262 domain-containing protein [Micromonospora sp. C41]|uniref:GmrSD restriction endonuclease domain-containing protein n=1 Tax=Micromonospora sp. C41 TaxID=2824878 RepID=UPI001B373346|nr:DUF262 domain-containing protein [Micromonospora sp. C41]MBQ1061381.1 DUF262 domain-containing protein [Micromonospora sp. C41]